MNDIRDQKSLNAILCSQAFEGVVHTAGLKSVAESFKNSHEYFEVNHFGTKTLIQELTKLKIRKIIFSSTAAVYGSPNIDRGIKESDPTDPISPYGESKLAAEKEVDNFINLPGNLGTSLRFFNVIGASDPQLRDSSKENLVPIVIDRLNSGLPPVIFGDDYATRDGTCIRDYVDVQDIARAHLLVSNSNKRLPNVMNVGTGKGTTVKEIIQSIKEELNRQDSELRIEGRRLGDPACLYSDVNLIEKELDFKAFAPSKYVI